MATTEHTMKALYGKLHAAGFNRKYVQSMLPDWWDDSIAATVAGYQEASIRLGNLFGVMPSTLRDPQIPPVLRVPEGRRFKRRAGHEEAQLDIACALSMTAATLVFRYLSRSDKREGVLDASAIRGLVLQKNPYIAFDALLDYVWQLGIPVLFLDYLPSKTKKMAGLAFECVGSPVIVLTSGRPHGFLVFDLAHELAHIALGHVANGRCVVDQEIDSDAEDPDEKAANRFALELLTGNPDCKIVPTGRHLNGQELAVQALRYGEKYQIDPMHVALNYGYTQNHWAVANLAIKQLAADKPSDQAILRERLFSQLRSCDISEDDLATLARLTGTGVE